MYLSFTNAFSKLTFVSSSILNLNLCQKMPVFVISVFFSQKWRLTTKKTCFHKKFFQKLGGFFGFCNELPVADTG